MYKNKVYIIGLGWLGLALAKQLQQTNNSDVSGTVTTKEKQTLLAKGNINSDVFSLYESINSQSNNGFHRLNLSKISDATVVINIPPGRKNFCKERYYSSIVNLIDQVFANGARKVIFISTTSVYGTQTGRIDQNSPVAPQTESGKAHTKIERYLLNHYRTNSHVVRPAGLVGPKKDSQLTVSLLGQMRHPVFTLSQKTQILNGSDPVNLIHQSDVVQAIIQLIINQYQTHTFNLAALDHPSRETYYSWCANKLGLNKPDFAKDTEKRRLGKLIDASDCFKQLGFVPKYSSVYDMIE